MKKSRRDATTKSSSSLPNHAVEPVDLGAVGERRAQVVWDEYWFTPQSATGLFRVQQLVYVVAAIWFLVQLRSLEFWWNETGFGARDLSASLEVFSEGDFLSRFRLTPLWMTQSSTMLIAWSLIGVVLSIASILNIAGRFSRIALAICTLCLAQRMSWAVGLVEPYLVALTAYLAIARMSREDDWSHRFATRLIQVHTWLSLCAACANQLAFESWWQGEAVWWLAANNRSTILTENWLEGRLLLVNALTHSVTLASLVASACLWPFTNQVSPWRLRLGISGGLWVAAAYALIADHFLYGVLLAAGILVWLVREKLEGT